MSNGLQGQQPGGGESGPSSFKAALRGSVPDPALLLRVLEQTLSSKDAPDAVEAADIERLKTVARQRHGQPLTVEPVAVEMVRAVLGAHFARLGKDPDTFNDITLQIARTLMEDPSACKRLETLWSRLNE
jgi:hypothetical protein